MICAGSLGLFGSQMIAASLALAGKWRSRQFSVTFNFAPRNHFISGFLKSHSRIFDHFFRHLRSEEHTSALQSPCNLVCRLLLEKKKTAQTTLTRQIV